MKPLTLLCPSNLNIDEIISKNKTTYIRHRLKKDKLIYICDALIKARANQRKRMEEENTEFVRLSSKFLDKVIHNYNYYLRFLIESKVLICNDSFVLGKACKGYKFSPQYLGHPNKEISRLSYSLKKSIRKAKLEWQKETKNKTWGYGYLTKWFESNKLDIDIEAAYKWIDNYEATKIENIKLKGLEVEPKINNAIETSKDFKLLVNRIKEGRHRYSFSGEGHRLYSTLTNLKKELKHFLTYDGKKLVSIDIKNSQPFLSLILFNIDFWHGENEKIGLKLINEGIRSIIKDSEEYRGIITLLKSPKILMGSGFGLNNYKKLVLSGGFYEYVQKHFEPLYPKRFSCRPDVKKEVMRILFSNPIDENRPFFKPCLTFGKHFETPYKLFKLIKQIEYTYFPIILQRLESFLVIDVICKKISSINDQIPLFTIHDNIITTEGNETIVEAIINEEMQRWIGYTPILDIEYLSPKEKTNKIR